jgi:esterase/lipase
MPASSLLHKRTFRTLAGTLLGLALLLLLVLLALTWGKELDERHSPLDYPDDFDFTSGTWADYSAWAERHLRFAQGEVATPEVLGNLGPFRLEPPTDCPASSTAAFRNGIVLTHSLLETPYSMREIGKYFQARCFLVYGLLLPGHGTRPGDFLQAGWQDWVAAERFAARELAREVDNLYLGGHGEGGTLAILEASNNAGVDGLILFAPALGARTSAWYDWLITPLSRLVPQAAWAQVVPDKAVYRYESWSYSLGVESNALIQATEAALPGRPFEVPVLTVASVEDTTVNVSYILSYMAERVHPMSATLLFSQQSFPAREGITVHNTYRPAETVLSTSHLGLMVPMWDPHFGWYGLDRNCTHYYRPDPEAYQRCMAGERAYLGEITGENLELGLVERIGFNPFYYEMLEGIDAFIAPVGRVIPRQLR